MKNWTMAFIVGAVLALACSVNAVPTFFTVSLDGFQEAPAPGDPDGTGTALFTIDPAATLIEWLITANDIDLPVTGAHIHQAPAGVAGPIIYDFEGALDGSGFIDAALAAAIVDDPLNYYVNVHNDPYPDGAIRGQLNEGITCPTAVIPVPSAIGLVMIGLAGLRLPRRRPS